MVFGDRIKPLDSKRSSTMDDPVDASPESARSADPEDRDRTTENDPAACGTSRSGAAPQPC